MSTTAQNSAKRKLRQNPWYFSVAICDERQDIWGTGFVISPSWQILTCRHVFDEACSVKKGGQKEALVMIPCRMRFGRTERFVRAVEKYRFPEEGEDLLLLDLRCADHDLKNSPFDRKAKWIFDPPPDLDLEWEWRQMGFLGCTLTSEVEGRRFRSYGYGEPADVTGLTISGIIDGRTEAKSQARNYPMLALRPERAIDLSKGMSGAAVLDLERSVVIGVIQSYVGGPQGNRIGYAEDCSMLESLGLRTLDSFDNAGYRIPEATFIEDVTAPVAMRSGGISVNSVPFSIGRWKGARQTWVGRSELLRRLLREWSGGERRALGITGFGGEGKSSVARQFVADLFRGPTDPPQWVIWWDFYEQRSASKFLEHILLLLAAENTDVVRTRQSDEAKIGWIAGILKHTGRYLFVLDGLEVLQHQRGSQFGDLVNPEMRKFLDMICDVDIPHQSFALITTRIPLAEMYEHGYDEFKLERLSDKDGTLLLRTLGVTGDDNFLVQIVKSWEGHALTLTLIGTFLRDQFGGDASKVSEMPSPVSGDDRYSRVYRVLRRYSENLTDLERIVMTISSVFSEAIPTRAFAALLRVGDRGRFPWGSVIGDAHSNLESAFKRLTAACLIRESGEQEFGMHPLVRAYFNERFLDWPREARRELQRRMADYFREAGGAPPKDPTVENLAPFMNSFHHSIQAEDYEEAFSTYRTLIEQRDPSSSGGSAALTYQLGQYPVDLELIRRFFPEGDFTRKPMLRSPGDVIHVLNEVGLCLMSEGHLREAYAAYDNALSLARQAKALHECCRILANMTEVNIHLGQLQAAVEHGNEAVEMGRRAKANERLWFALGNRAWAYHLLNRLREADHDFEEAATVLRLAEPDRTQLVDLWAVWYADHLRRAGRLQRAQELTEYNLRFGVTEGYNEIISQCQRVLGEIAADQGREDDAEQHFDAAWETARRLRHLPAQLEALLARGMLRVRRGEDPQELREALRLARDHVYRIYEVDICVGLARHRAATGGGDYSYANCAKMRSRETGYYRGQVAAAEL